MTQPKIEDVGHGKPVMPFGSDGTDWYAFLIDALGHLQVDVVSAALGSGGATETTLLLIKGYVDTLETLLAGGLPAALDSGALKVKEQSPLTGFATSANQATMITALQLIDDLRAALGSVNTDDLQVDVKTYPGSNALGNIPFGYNDVYGETKTAGPVSGTQTLSGSVVPAGEVWVVTQATAGHTDATARVTAIRGYMGGVSISIASDRALAQYANLTKQGSWVLKKDDYMEIVVEGLTAGSFLQCWFSGYKMKVA